MENGSGIETLNEGWTKKNELTSQGTMIQCPTNRRVGSLNSAIKYTQKKKITHLSKRKKRE